MSHPVHLVDYSCGHSTPVRGTGGVVDRPCPDCQAAGQHDVRYCAECATRAYTTPAHRYTRRTAGDISLGIRL